MYAVIETGGKQYRVEVGTQLEVELLDVEPGKTITLDRVLLVADGDQASIGQPVVTDAQVSAEVVSQIRGPKTISFKYRPKARSRVKKGHRQELTVLRISDIVLAGKSAAADSKKAADAAKTERVRLEEAAADAGRQGRRARRQAGRERGAGREAGQGRRTEEDHHQGPGHEGRDKADAAPAKAGSAAKKAAPAAKKPAAKAKAAPAEAKADAKADAPAKKPTRATKKDE